MFNVLNDVDLVPSNVQFSHQKALAILAQGHFSLKNHLAFAGGEVFCESLCCFLMPSGWSRAPDGWWQRSLSPRSPSEVWPRVQQFRQPGPPQPSTRGKGPDKVRSLEAALAELGAEDVAAKTEVEAALERAREEKTSTVESGSPLEPRRSSGTCLMQGETFRGGVEGNGRCAGSRGRVLAGRIKESSTGSPRAPTGQPVVRVQKVHRAFRASFGEDRCGTRSRDGTAQRGTQSSDPSRSPSRGVAARRAATHPCSGFLRRIGRIEGEVGFHGTGTRRGMVCTSLQAASDVTNRSGSPWHPTSDSRFVRACRFVLVDGRSSCGVVRGHLDWGPGPHPEAHVHDGRVRRTVASVDRVQAIFRTVNSRYGLRGVRVGEASHPGPASKRRRTHTLRALEDIDSEDEQPLVRSVSVPLDVVKALERDLCEQCPDPATTQLSSTVPASSGAVREVHQDGVVPPRVGPRFSGRHTIFVDE